MKTWDDDYPKVKLICDSVNKNGERISTFEVQYWRPILAETNTHRVLSRNAASSRAQSFQSRCEKVATNPVVPNHWNAEQRGMVGGEEFSPEIKDYINERIQRLAKGVVEKLQEIDHVVEMKTGNRIHKQYLNRYLEPFTATTQLITSTEWDNFFKLRCAPDAQPEIRDLALKMRELLETCKPVETELHMPYVREADRKMVEDGLISRDDLTKLAVARCARVSYKTYDNSDDIERDFRLYNRLLESGHMSPFEHIAFSNEFNYGRNCYNLIGWYSLRYCLEVLA